MKITLEQIDELKKRANVGYKDAKEALEKFDGDLVEALAYLDGEKKIKSGNYNTSDLWSKCKKLISKGNRIKLKITKNEGTIISVPITLVIIFGLITFPLFAASMVLAIITGCKIRFIKENGMDCAINRHLEKVAVVVNETAQRVTEDFKKA
jgi:hypothetical protein